jgi:hypothetical protein
MDAWLPLLKDEFFLTAFAALSGSVLLFLYLLFQLRSPAKAPVAAVPVPGAARSSTLPPTPLGTGEETQFILSMMQERLTEMADRLTALETAQSAAAPVDALGRRLDEIEKEVAKVKTFVSGNPPPAGGAGDLAALTDRVNALQRLLEALASEPGGAKPA